MRFEASRRVSTLVGGCLGALALGAASSASATVVQWADLTSYNPSTGVVTGTITVGSEVIDITISGGGYNFVNLGNPGETNYWTEPNALSRPYTGGEVENAPPGTDIIALSTGGLKTITFSQTVSNVYLALVSWNGNSGVFDQPFEIVSSGRGYWGTGSFTSVTDTSFTGSGELHGIIKFTGTFDEVSFTDRSELWHGIQIGIAGLAPPPVGGIPEPGTWALMISGFGLAGGALRRSHRRQTARGLA